MLLDRFMAEGQSVWYESPSKFEEELIGKVNKDRGFFSLLLWLAGSDDGHGQDLLRPGGYVGGCYISGSVRSSTCAE